METTHVLKAFRQIITSHLQLGVPPNHHITIRGSVTLSLQIGRVQNLELNLLSMRVQNSTPIGKSSWTRVVESFLRGSEIYFIEINLPHMCRNVSSQIPNYLQW